MSILRIVGSEELACGCFAGVYELYSGQVIELIDFRGEGCTVSWHTVGTAIPRAPALDRRLPHGHRTARDAGSAPG
jgi:hypothetical protein